MGNSPSTPKTSPSSSSQAASQLDQTVRRDSGNPIPVQRHRVSAPPEPSLTQAQDTAVQPQSSTGPGATTTTASRPKLLPSSHQHSRHLGPGSAALSGSPAASSSSAGSAKPLEVGKQGRPSDPSYEPAKPVAVPNPHINSSSPQTLSHPSPRDSDGYDAAAMAHNSLQDAAYLTRPPRLPLPIEEEVHTPGSPILTAADVTEPLDDVDGLDSAGLNQPTSNLSDTSMLEEEDAEELLVDKTRPTVPTRLVWRHGGEKVYVTGTIFQWNRKTRLHPVEGQPGVFATTINILPGTHHVRFLVDGQMQTTPDYPTTVDYANNLVNYIEVAPLDQAPAPAEAAEATSEVKSAQPQAPAEDATPEEAAAEAPAPKYRDVPRADEFRQKIPQYLNDLDQAEDSPAYHNAIMATERLPNPPALPGFLSKPILNVTATRKDDNSVLPQPNHTVLNHLATSSIKNNVLAVSATTRYKGKYVTTIMYKPTTTEGI
ncbi:hypothetical protein VTJ49DRAFT_6121 [Mycothermus thermophilus]|uniref:Association with the SNF1 complex (ASC) domain-containing protein n=1 Tax=Humicola insolens TaxID=85995 RepID=A0ABR3VKN6_HUMIN